MNISPDRFAHLTFEDFQTLATDASLSANEKIGFPEGYRVDEDDAILAHFFSRLPMLLEKNRVVLDIGCGCSGVAQGLIAHAEKLHHQLLLSDSNEMLAHLPDHSFLRKIPGAFPSTLPACQEYAGKIDVVLIYSVLHHVLLSQDIFYFLDAALSLLAPNGALLLGDLPNISKRDRFLSSPQGVEFHQRFTGKTTPPPVSLLSLKPHKIDDGIVFAILQRYRNAGFETYLLPQPSSLAMHNRREDILIRKW